MYKEHDELVGPVVPQLHHLHLVLGHDVLTAAAGPFLPASPHSTSQQASQYIRFENRPELQIRILEVLAG